MRGMICRLKIADTFWLIFFNRLIINHLNLPYLKIVFFLLFILASISLTAQERNPLNGKVTSEYDDLEGIYVINRTADLSTITTRGGYFTINAAAKDTIIFSSVQFVARELIVEEPHLKEELLFVSLETLTRELDELIIVDYRHINAESLGLVPRGQKQYTPAEKKVFTATNGVDGLFNALSGRTAMLKKAAETAKKEELMDKINYIYTEEDIITKFHIPKEYVKGFVFFIVEDSNFARAIRDKNDTMAKFLMSGLSVRYLEIIKE
jgi:hypothetical protein